MKSIHTLAAAALFTMALSTPVQAQLYTADKTGLADAVHDYTIGSWWESIIVDKLMSFKLSPGCWAKMTEKDGWGISTTTNFARAMNDYTKNGGMPDLEAIESANNNDRANNKPQVEQQIDAMKNKVSFSLQADGIKCNGTEWDLLHRFMSTIGEAIAAKTFKPKGGAAFVTMIMSPTAKDISVVVNPDGKHFIITCPAETEPSDWSTKIEKGLHRGSL